MDVLDTLSLQLETVSRNVPKYFEFTHQIADLIKPSAKVVQINRKLYRMPVQMYNAGNHKKMGGDFAAYGVGTGPDFTHLTGGYIRSSMAYSIPDEVIDNTNRSESAVLDVLAEMLKNCITEVKVMDDITLHTDGTGILTGPSSAPVAGGAGTASSTITFADSSDLIGIRKLHVGMSVDVWSQTGATKRAPSSGTAPTFITAINPSTKVVTLNQSIAAVSPSGSQDILTFRGLDAYGPSTLATGTSTFPDATGSAQGIGGDSYRHGMYYVNDVTASTYYLGVLKSSLPSMITNAVDAEGATINWALGRRLQDQIIIARSDPDARIVGVAALETRRDVEALGIQISQIMITGNALGKQVDVGDQGNRSYNMTFNFDGLTHHLSKRQRPDRIDYLDLGTWHRAQLFEDRFVQGGDSGKPYLFYRRSTVDGTITTGRDFYYEQAYDLFSEDPAREGYIYNLSYGS